MTKLHALTAGLAAALLLGACGSAANPQAAAEQRATDQVALSRATLSQAADAAHRYGQAHLGHYLDVALKDLLAEGLESPTGISISVRGDHTGYCITAVNAELPSIHPWATATVSSTERKPSTADACRTTRKPIQKR